ncbi:DUF4097 family beta strand repeat protein [candidate division KSB1 bacterium]|nr:DUF4097 family beta strand repeat protein [candidate division KSB1 bacterium]MBL7094520.1 DUF4097 family beta strand repeat protein [candidate division KSB1 bacterium]
MKKDFLLIALACLLIFNLPSVLFSKEVKKTYKKTFQIDPGGYVTVKGDDGFISVESWDKPGVQLTWTKSVWGKNRKQAEEILEQVEVRINHTGNRLTVKVVEPNHRHNFNFWDLFDPDTWGSRNFRSPVVDFELMVPREINLSFSNDEGDVTVNSIDGDVDIDVDEGDIELRDINFGDINLYADEGDITGTNLKSETGSITIEIDEGETSLKNVETRKLRLNCDEGESRFENFKCSSCNISTDEGDIDLDILLQKNDRYQVYTDEGDVYFYLSKNPDVRFDLETQDGSIRTDFDLSIKKKDDYQQCRDSIGNGSSLIKAYTDEGVINVRKR